MLKPSFTTRLTRPSYLAITLAEAKAQARIAHPEEDGLVQSYIEAAQATVERLCERAFSLSNFRAVFVGELDELILPCSPVQSITSVSIDGAQLTADDYTFEPCDGTATIRVNNPQSATRATVEFVAGYESAGDIPTPLRQAVALLTSELYEHRTASDSLTWKEIPFGVKALIEPYKSLVR